MTARYTTRILKGAGLVEPAKEVLRGWQLERGLEANLAPFRRAGALGRVSAQRTGDILSIITSRYLEDAHVRRALVRLAQSRPEWPTLEMVLGYHAALADRLLFDCAARLLYARRARGLSTVTADDVYAFLGEKGLLEGEGPWSSRTARRVARNLLSAWRDFGVLEGEAKKTLNRKGVPTAVVVWIATHLSSASSPPPNLQDAEAFRLVLLTPEEVERHLVAADARGWLRYQGGGAVARLDLHHASVEELAHALG